MKKMLSIALCLFILSVFARNAESKIAFSSNRDGDYEIYIMNNDGTGLTKLTNNATDDIWPVFSPNGSKITFTSNGNGNYEVYVMNSDGTNQTRLTSDSAEDWASDWYDNQIAFTSNRSGTYEVYTMNSDGSNQERLTFNWPFEDADPSCYENKIAFTSNISGGLPPDEASYNIRLLTILDDEHQEERNLTNTGDNGYPRFSPDGTKIAFSSNAHGGSSEIYTMNSSYGDGKTRLTYLNACSQRAHWSPDGFQIAFESDSSGNSEIYVMNSNGSNMVNLTNNSAEDITPAWYENVSPDVPVNISPADGVSGTSLTPTLQASSFLDQNIGNTHQASQWQIRTETGTYSSPLWNSGIDTTNKTAITVPSGNLDYNNIYYWHVRYQDNNDSWSEWSNETSFTTEAEPDPSPYCGDGTCNGTETCSSCPGDCGTCPSPICGNGVCDAGETCSSCPGDCGSCGDGGDDSGSSGGGGKSGCFIATACYGTPMAYEVRVLSRFRDECLLTNPVGKIFVNTYYKISPPIADFIRQHPLLKNTTRKFLKPLIWMAKENQK
ncbi:hypothetical protein KKC91_09200 [bacterium]|nr:hypothetical protein [bacterium]